MSNSEDIVGRAPTSEELRFIELAAALSPVESLRRIETRSGFVLTNIGLLGTLMALAVRVGTPHDVHSRVASAITVISGFGAALFALLANMPSFRLGINRSNIEDVRSYFESQIKLKGWLTRISFLLLLVTFVSGAVALLIATLSRHRPRPPR